MIRLGELLDITSPTVCIRVPPTRDADPWIRWARALEDPDELGRIADGELIVTEGRWRRSPLDTDRLVCALAARRAAALTLSTDSDDFLGEVASACKRWHLPLLTASGERDDLVQTALRLIVARADADAARSVDGEASSADGELEPELVEALRDQRPPAAIVAALTRRLGRTIWLLGRATVIGPAPPTDADLVTAAEAVSGRTGTVSLRLSSGPATAFAVAPSTDSSRPAAHLICDGDEARLTSADRRLIDMTLAYLRVELELTRRRRADRALVAAEFHRRGRSADAGDEELAAWTRALGVDPSGYVICIVITAARATPLDIADLTAALENLADAFAIPRVVIADDFEVSALLFVGDLDERVSHAITRAKLALGPELARVLGAFGTSSVIAHEIADVIRLPHDARRVCQLNQLRTQAPSAPPLAPAPPLSALLLIADDEARRALHQTVLEPLVSYDEQHGSELLRTLDVFLSSNAQWSSSAAQLGVHVNTLRYRISRIQKCTGRDLGSMADRVDFYVALRAREATQQVAEEPSQTR